METLSIIGEGSRLQQLFGNLTTNEAPDTEETDYNNNDNDTQHLIPICAPSSFISQRVGTGFSEAVETLAKIGKDDNIKTAKLKGMHEDHCTKIINHHKN